MHFTRNRGAIATVVALLLLALIVVPASAAPGWEPAPRAEARESLFAQLWDWLGSLFAADPADPEETNAAGTCTAPGSSRGCAIDPNGGTGDY